MKDDECNILVNLSREEYREFRSLVIDMVLATDMSCHFQQIKAAKSLLTVTELRQSSNLLCRIARRRFTSPTILAPLAGVYAVFIGPEAGMARYRQLRRFSYACVRHRASLWLGGADLMAQIS